MTNTYIYSFRHHVPMDEVEGSLLLAALATESLFGRALMRMEARFRLNTKQRFCSIDGSTDIGRALACIFTGFLSREFGDRGFRLNRLDASRPAYRKEDAR
jgi:hypothetical protein